MDTAHVSILQANHDYLMENLKVEPVLNALYKDGIFTQEEYDKCNQAGTKKCEKFLEILKGKGVEAYKKMCEVLAETQPAIRERLDATGFAVLLEK